MTAVKTILDKIAARLAIMTVANGYNYGISVIERAKLTPFKNGDLPALNYWVTTEIVSNKQFFKQEHEILLTIEYYNKTLDLPFSDVAFNLAADVITALNRDTTAPTVAGTQSPSLGGTVTELNIMRVVPVIGEGQSPWCGAIIELQVKYFTDTNNPYTISNP